MNVQEQIVANPAKTIYQAISHPVVTVRLTYPQTLPPRSKPSAAHEQDRLMRRALTNLASAILQYLDIRDGDADFEPDAIEDSDGL